MRPKKWRETHNVSGCGSIQVEQEDCAMLDTGCAYLWTHIDDDLDIGTPIYYLYTAPANDTIVKRTRASAVVRASNVVKVEIYGGSTITNIGTARAFLNKTTASANVCNSAITISPTVSAVGTKVAEFLCGGSGKSGIGGIGELSQMQPTAGDVFLFKITTLTNNTLVNFIFEVTEVLQ